MKNAYWKYLTLYPITPEDIDISHVVRTQRQDNKNVAICKFVQRKTKFRILNAKKAARDWKFKGNTVFINEHLSPGNRDLFSKASEAKRLYDFKYLWVKYGTIFMRHSDRSQLIRIEKLEDIPISNPTINEVNVLNEVG